MHGQNNSYNEIGMRCMMKTKETNKRCLMEMEMGQKEEEVANDLDLSLGLSPPKRALKGELSNRSKASSPSSQETCTSLSLNRDENVGGSRYVVEVPSLVLMGCTHCFIYVLVSELNPQCPKCKTSVLIDMFRQPAKRFKKC